MTNKKRIQISKIEEDCSVLTPIALLVDLLDGTQKEITFKGGDSSAQAINGACDLADILEEDYVDIWDINKEMHRMDILEAMEISVNIAKEYRRKMFKRNDLITQINKATTIEEVEGITWIED